MVGTIMLFFIADVILTEQMYYREVKTFSAADTKFSAAVTWHEWLEEYFYIIKLVQFYINQTYMISKEVRVLSNSCASKVTVATKIFARFLEQNNWNKVSSTCNKHVGCFASNSKLKNSV